MANQRKFTTHDVLDKLLDLFWRKGYEATSLDDLTEATGVKRQSLYNAFGNKDEMYKEALQHYQDLLAAQVFTAFTHKGHSLNDHIAHIFETYHHFLYRDATPPGCFLVNAAIEFGYQPWHPVTLRLKQHFDMIEETFWSMLDNAQQQESLSQTLNTRILSSLLADQFTALAVRARLAPKQQTALAYKDELLSCLAA